MNPEHITPNQDQSPTDNLENGNPEIGEQPAVSGTPNENRAAAAVRRVRQRAVPQVTAAAARVRHEFGTRHTTRATPKVRLAQLGAAAVAAGVLGVTLGNAQQPDQQAQSPHTSEQSVVPAAHATPLAAPAAAPAVNALSAPATGAAPAAQSIQPQPNNLDGWVAQAHQVLLANGVPPDKINPDDLRSVIQHESGGNPTATNNWDSNAKKGTPSKGLMQTIDPTFQAFALPGHTNIYNPVDNIVSATRYSIQQYGSVSNIPGVESTKSGSSYQGY